MAENHTMPDSSTPLVALQSKDHEEILDAIDHLRQEGVSSYLDLPQLVVCGDQSSGKSSVLEAISGLGFPTKDNLCTRFATELILRRGPDSGVTVSIHPDEERSEEDKRHMRDFRSRTVSLSDFKDIITDAERIIGVGNGPIQFSKDVLRVEVSGPTQPHLTMVDLPGLYHAPDDDDQDEAGVGYVESLVLSYIRNPRSVILAVVSAKSDIALQKVTKFTRKVDPNGERTLGVVTKPDTLIKTSEMERSFVDLAKNRRVVFRLGWHVLKNRDHDMRHLSLTQQRDLELAFLTKGVWTSLDSSQIGIDALRPRLSSVLKDHILQQLPSLIKETQQSFNDTKEKLSRMGDARQTTGEQRHYLLNCSDKFTALLGDAINGNYSQPVFGDAMDDDNYQKRLRAVIQNELSDFSDIIWEKGEKRRLIDDEEEGPEIVGEEEEEEEEEVNGHIGQKFITRSDFVTEVQQRMRRSRGRELPGMFNPLIVGDLFYIQAQPWEELVNASIDNVLESVQRTVYLFMESLLDQRTKNGVLSQIVDPQLEKLGTALRMKTSELLKPQQSGHPITYNHYFTETVQKARETRLRNRFKETLKGFFGRGYPAHESSLTAMQFRMDDLIEALATQTEANMERFACSEAIDYMQAYYKVSDFPATMFLI